MRTKHSSLKLPSFIFCTSLLILIFFQNCSLPHFGVLSGSSSPFVFKQTPTALESCHSLDITNLASATKPNLIDAGGLGILDTMDNIRYPIWDGKPMYIPTNEFPDQTYLRCGILDVTQSPFNLDPTGK